MNVFCVNYLVIVFENGNKWIDIYIVLLKYIFDGIILVVIYEVCVVCKENLICLKLNLSLDILKGIIFVFFSSVILLVFIYFYIIINDKFNLFVIQKYLLKLNLF